MAEGETLRWFVSCLCAFFGAECISFFVLCEVDSFCVYSLFCFTGFVRKYTHQSTATAHEAIHSNNAETLCNHFIKRKVQNHFASAAAAAAQFLPYFVSALDSSRLLNLSFVHCFLLLFWLLDGLVIRTSYTVHVNGQNVARSQRAAATSWWNKIKIVNH